MTQMFMMQLNSCVQEKLYTSNVSVKVYGLCRITWTVRTSMHSIRPLIIRSANLADTKKASHSPACFLPYCFLLINCISYRKTSAISFFVRLSSFFAHNLFTNFQYHKTIKNNNRFLIDFFHTFLSFEAGFVSVSFFNPSS